MTTRTYPEGVPSWVDIAQADTDATRAFYTELFGWSLVGDDYLIAMLDGRPVAGIGVGGERPWTAYVAVDDADATAARIADAGGTLVSGPDEQGDDGRAAACTDATGAPFRLWQARDFPGAQAVNEPGAWNFCDLRTGDPETAKAFYGAVFGWELGDMGLWRRPGYGDHMASTFDPGIHERHRAIGAPPGFEDSVAWLAEADGDSHWNVTFAVADRDDGAAAAERLGATVLGTEDTPWTRTAQIRDPQGADLTLSQFTPPS